MASWELRCEVWKGVRETGVETRVHLSQVSVPEADEGGKLEDSLIPEDKGRGEQTLQRVTLL